MLSPIRLICALVLLLLSHLPMLSAQDKIRLLFSFDANAEQAREMDQFDLRPNVELPFYVFIKNSTIDQRDVIMSVSYRQKQNLTQHIELKKLEPRKLTVPPKSNNKDAVIPVEFKLEKEESLGMGRELIFKLEDAIRKDDAGQFLKIDERKIHLNIMKAEDYLSFSPAPSIDETGTLIVEVKQKDNFRGPPCKLKLDLSRLQNLAEGQAPNGTLKDVIDGEDNKKATLTLNKLRFIKDKSQGFFSVSVDDVARAKTLVARDMVAGSYPEALEGNTLRIMTDRFCLAAPDKVLNIFFEVDNPEDRDATLDFEIDRTGTGNFKPSSRPHYRNEQILLKAGNGALLLKPVVSDWMIPVQTDGLEGKGAFKARLVKKNGPSKTVEHSTVFSKELPKIKNIVIKNSNESIKDSQATFLVGEEINVEVDAQSPTEIQEVTVFAGEAMPTDISKLTKAVLRDNGWHAKANMPGQKGRYKLFVSAKNGIGLGYTEILELKVVEATPSEQKDKAGGTIKGQVVQGVDDRPQRDLPVELLDTKGTQVKTTRTDEKGNFVFKDIAAGSYTVSAKRVNDKTKASAQVSVENGKETVVKAMSLKR